MKGYAYLVDVNWALLLWFGLLFINLICSIIQTKSDSKLRKEIVRQNELIREQNSMILKQNGQLATVIIRACSKNVRDRKNAQQEDQPE